MKPMNANKTVFFNILSTVVLQGMAFFTAPLFSRLLGTENYGLITVYNTWVSLAAVLLTFEPHTTLVMAKKEYPEDAQKKYHSSVLFLSLCFFAVCAGLILVFLEPVSALVKLPKLAVILVLIQSFGNICVSLLTTRYTHEFRADRNAAIAIGITVANVAVSTVLILNMPQQINYMGRMIGLSSVYGIAALLICILTFRRGKTFFDRTYWKFAITLTVPMIFHGLSNLIMGHSDRVMLQWYMGNSVVGIYGLANSFASVMISIWTALSGSWSPFFFEDMRQEQFDKVKNRSKNYLELYTVLAMGFVLLTREVFHVFASEEFWGGVDIVFALTASNYFTFLYSMPLNYELYHKKTKAVAAVTVVTAVLNVTLNVVLITLMGALGAAVATAISMFAKFLFHYLYAKRIPADTPYPFCLRMFAPYAGAFLLVLVISLTLPQLWWLRWGLGACVGVWELVRIWKRKMIF